MFSCEICSKPFVPLALNQRVCGKECRAERARRADRNRYAENAADRTRRIERRKAAAKRPEVRERENAAKREVRRKFAEATPRTCPACLVPFVKPPAARCVVYCSAACRIAMARVRRVERAALVRKSAA